MKSSFELCYLLWRKQSTSKCISSPKREIYTEWIFQHISKILSFVVVLFMKIHKRYFYLTANYDLKIEIGLQCQISNRVKFFYKWKERLNRPKFTLSKLFLGKFFVLNFDDWIYLVTGSFIKLYLWLLNSSKISQAIRHFLTFVSLLDTSQKVALERLSMNWTSPGQNVYTCVLLRWILMKFFNTLELDAASFPPKKLLNV